MLAQNSFQDDSKQTDSAQTPAIKNSWRFGDLSAAELLPQLQQYLQAQDDKVNWQLVWLNNDGQQVIGLLPKIAWCVYFDDIKTKQTSLYKVVKSCRDDTYSMTNATMRYTEWQDELIAYSRTYEIDSNDSSLISEHHKKPSYHHGLIGFIGYDIAAHELSPAAKIERSLQPCAALGHYDIYLTPCHDKEAGWTLNTISLSNNNQPNNATLAKLISYLDVLDYKLSQIDETSNDKLPLAPLTLTAQWYKDDYQNAFEKTERYLQQGDCYQINLTQAWQGYFNRLDNSCSNKHSVTTLIDYLPALDQNTHAPFAGYLGIGHHLADSKNDYSTAENVKKPPLIFELLSCSPELFFTFIKEDDTGSHHIITKPIKGTRPRGKDDEQDLALKQQLIDSHKDRAENVMIVDLLRNDLGKYAKTGSVKVPYLFAIESFSNVHHMVSTITAELKSVAHPLTVLFGSLPAGSITGTPKKRAVEIISELEAGPRGAYCGTMGYMNFDGSGQWNVLIRTLQADVAAGKVSLWAGGGITVASDCLAEYQECLDKVGNLLTVLTQ